MRNDPFQALQSADVARRLDVAGFTQQDLAKVLGVSQSQVSRILSGQFKRRSKLFDDLCKIAYQSTGAVEGARPGASAQQADLTSALDAVWDGTDSHAKALAVVIRSLSALMKPTKALACWRRPKTDHLNKEVPIQN
jgi:transcriptional regulator with XRE-family HTH domain